MGLANLSASSPSPRTALRRDFYGHHVTDVLKVPASLLRERAVSERDEERRAGEVTRSS